jgi:hypothetical protein
LFFFNQRPFSRAGAKEAVIIKRMEEYLKAAPDRTSGCGCKARGENNLLF